MALFSSRKRPSLSDGRTALADSGGENGSSKRKSPSKPSTVAIDLQTDEYETPAYLTPFPEEVARVGLIAGGGQFPMLLAGAARSRGVEVTAFAIKGFAEKKLEDAVDAIEWLELGALGKLIKSLREKKISQIAMVGRVAHSSVLSYRHFDSRAMKLLASAINRKADTLLELVCRELAKEGVEVLDSTLFLRSFLPKPGPITNARKLTAREREDIEFGIPLARQIAGMDIGQSIAIKDKVVLAVEGIEGTDECLRRAADLGGEGVVLVKVSKPDQDRRFDVPVIGPDTIAVMKEIKGAAISVSAGETLIFHREEVVKAAEEAGVAIVATPNPPPPPLEALASGVA